MAAAAEKYSGAVDVSEDLSSKPRGKVSRILDGVYHSHGGADDADLDEYDGWVDLGLADPEEKRKVLKKKVEEAYSNGMYRKGFDELEKLLAEFS